MSLSDKPNKLPPQGDPQCVNCMFYRPSEHLTQSARQPVGRCYLRPPTYVGSGANYNELLWTFPAVKETDFCGEFLDK